MTNRPDMIDEALLRPGRLEVKIEIGLPDEQGRVQILNIHTEKFKTTGIMADDISILDLAQKTKNFTGAEIAGFCRSAASFALNRQVDVQKAGSVDVSKVKLVAGDFEAALQEVSMHVVHVVHSEICNMTCFNCIVLYARWCRRLAPRRKTCAVCTTWAWCRTATTLPTPSRAC
jgi:SpoVK/Ycf46/Vps4 family AAA+-type ATPase